MINSITVDMEKDAKTLCSLTGSNTVNRNTVKSRNNSSVSDSNRFILSMRGRIDLKCLLRKSPTSLLTQGIIGHLLLSYLSNLQIKKLPTQKKKETVQYSQSDDVLFWECLCGWWWRAGSSFSLLVEMADERPRARQGCQFSLSKSCVALECLEGERRGETKTNLNDTLPWR